MDDSSTSRARTRSVRRHVRTLCLLHVEGAVVHGITRDLSATGLYVRAALRREHLDRLSVGTRLAAELRLPGSTEALSLEVMVVWTNPDERDASGQAAVGLGLRFSGGAAGAHARVKAFLERFRYTVLAVDEDTAQLRFVEEALASELRVLTARAADEAIAILEREDVAVLLVGQRLLGGDGIELLDRVSLRMPHAHTARVLMGTHLDDVERAINIGRLFGFLKKPFNAAELAGRVRRATEWYAMASENERLSAELERQARRVERENALLRRRVGADERKHGLVGRSPALLAAVQMLERVAKTDSTVHLHGETGTGKEVFARAIHEGSPRASKPFITHNCAGMTESLLQSTLFGHVKGAFTGADRERPGIFQEANGGTLFLDEVAELPPSVQAALLRAVQSGEVKAVGSQGSVKVDVRLISATHKDLKTEVMEGRFRADLYFRLVVLELKIPPLRERPGDVPILARHFLDLLCGRMGLDVPGFSVEAMEALERYDWPGNVRELQNEIERLVVLTEPGAKIPAELLSPRVREHRPLRQGDVATDLLYGLSYDEAVEQVQRRLIEQALLESGGVVSRAAETLRIERTRLTKLIQRLGIRR